MGPHILARWGLPALAQQLHHSQHLTPSCQHVPPLLRGDLGINASIVELKVVGHVDVPHLGLQVADFVIAGLKGSYELIDVGVGHGELLGSNGSVSLHCGGGSIGHCAHNFGEFIPAEVDEGLGQAGGQGGIGLTVWWWVDSYLEQRWQYLLD